MSNTHNLSPWKKGVSGNISGRPKGSRNLTSVVRDLLDDDELLSKLRSKKIIKPDDASSANTASEAIAIALITKAIRGDVQAAEWLRKTACYEILSTAEADPVVALVQFIGED